jgi:hypothetical protein
VARAICSVGVTLKVISDPGKLVEATASDPDLVVVDAGDDVAGTDFHRAFMSLAQTSQKSRAVLFSDLTARETILDLLDADMLHHVLATSAPNALGRLAICLAKILGGKIFGMSKYVPWGTQIHEVSFRRSGVKQELLGELARFCEQMVIPKRLARLAGTVADEFVMNALYDAPTDASGAPIFTEIDRNQEVELPRPHEARFRYCCTGESLVLSIFDSFGSLDAPTVRANLLRTLSGGEDQVRRGSAGAGVGLFLAFKALADWVINVHPGRGTEMIGVIRAGGTYRDHVAMPKSFNLFFAEQTSEEWVGVPTGPRQLRTSRLRSSEGDRG